MNPQEFYAFDPGSGTVLRSTDGVLVPGPPGPVIVSQHDLILVQRR